MDPFALSLSKGRSWFDRACPESVEGLTTRGFRGLLTQAPRGIATRTRRRDGSWLHVAWAAGWSGRVTSGVWPRVDTRARCWLYCGEPVSGSQPCPLNSAATSSPPPHLKLEESVRVWRALGMSVMDLGNGGDLDPDVVGAAPQREAERRPCHRRAPRHALLRRVSPGHRQAHHQHPRRRGIRPPARGLRRLDRLRRRSRVGRHHPQPPASTGPAWMSKPPSRAAATN